MMQKSSTAWDKNMKDGMSHSDRVKSKVKFSRGYNAPFLLEANKATAERFYITKRREKGSRRGN